MIVSTTRRPLERNPKRKKPYALAANGDPFVWGRNFISKGHAPPPQDNQHPTLLAGVGFLVFSGVFVFFWFLCVLLVFLCWVF